MDIFEWATTNWETLVEAPFAIGLLAILSAVAGFRYCGHRNQPAISQLQQTISQLQIALSHQVNLNHEYRHRLADANWRQQTQPLEWNIDALLRDGALKEDISENPSMNENETDYGGAIPSTDASGAIDEAKEFLDRATGLEHDLQNDIERYRNLIQAAEDGDFSEGDADFFFSHAEMAASQIFAVKNELGSPIEAPELERPEIVAVGEYTVVAGPFQTPAKVELNSAFLEAHKRNLEALSREFEKFQEDINLKRHQLRQVS